MAGNTSSEAKYEDAGASHPSLVPVGHLLGKAAIVLKRPVILIGSRSNARIHLISSSVSKAHCLLVKSNGRFYVRDLASRERVFVNGEAVRESDLTDGDLLKIGKFTFKYVDGDGGVLRKSKLLSPASIESPDVPLPIPLDERVCLIGRRTNSDIPLMEASVSTSHAVIFEMDGRRYVRDLGSRTGTFVNGVRVHQHALNDADGLRIGDTDLTYRITPLLAPITELDLGVDDAFDTAAVPPPMSVAGVQIDDLLDGKSTSDATASAIPNDLETLEPEAIDAVAPKSDEPVAIESADEPIAIEPEQVAPDVETSKPLEGDLSIGVESAHPQLNIADDTIPLSVEGVEETIVEAIEESLPPLASDDHVNTVEVAAIDVERVEPARVDEEVDEIIPIADAGEPEADEARPVVEEHVPDEVVASEPKEESVPNAPARFEPAESEPAIPVDLLDLSVESNNDAVETVADNASSIPDDMPTEAAYTASESAISDLSTEPPAIPAPREPDKKSRRGRKAKRAEQAADAERVDVNRTRKSRRGPRADIIQDSEDSAGESLAQAPRKELPPAPPEIETAGVEIVAATESTPESALGTALDIVPSDVEVAAEAASKQASDEELTDTSFGRSVAEFMGSGIGDIVEAAATSAASARLPSDSVPADVEDESTLPELDLSDIELPDITASARGEMPPDVENAPGLDALRLEDLEFAPVPAPIIDPVEAPLEALADGELDLNLEVPLDQADERPRVTASDAPAAAASLPVEESAPSTLDDELNLDDLMLPPIGAADDFDALIADAIGKAEPPVPPTARIPENPAEATVVEPPAGTGGSDMSRYMTSVGWGANQDNFLGGQPVNLRNIPIPPDPVQPRRPRNPFAQEPLLAETAREFAPRISEPGQSLVDASDDPDAMDGGAATGEAVTGAIETQDDLPAEVSGDAALNAAAPQPSTEASGEVGNELDEVSAILDEMIAEPASRATTDDANEAADTANAVDLESLLDDLPSAEALPENATASGASPTAHEADLPEVVAPDSPSPEAIAPERRLDGPEPGMPVRPSEGAGNGEPSTLPPVRPVPRRFSRKPVETPRRRDRGELPSRRKLTPFGSFGQGAERDRVDETIPPYESKANGSGRVRNFSGGFGGDGLPPVVETDVFARMSPPGNGPDGDTENAPPINTGPAAPSSAQGNGQINPITGAFANDALPIDGVVTPEFASNGEPTEDAFWRAGRVAPEATEAAPMPRAARRGRAAVPPSSARAATRKRDDEELTAAEIRSRRIRRVPMLLLAWIFLTVATGAAVYQFIPQTARVEGSFVYSGLKGLNEAEQKEFKRSQRERLLNDFNRATAMRLLGEQSAVTGPGFLASADAYKSVAEGARWSDTKSNVLTVSLQSNDRVADRQRVDAVMAAFYQSNEVLQSEAKSRRQKLEDLERSVTANSQRLDQLGNLITEAKANLQNRPTITQIKAVEADAGAMEKAYNDAISTVKNLQADLQRLREQPTAGVNGTAPAAIDSPASDVELRRMQSEFDDLRAKLAAAKLARANEADAARKSLDAAMEQFQGQIADAQKSMKGNPELTAYIAAASKLQNTTHSLLDDMVKKQQQNFTMLTELRQRLSEQSEARRREQFEKDPQLREMIDQRELINRQYNTAIGAGLKKESEDYRAQLELAETRIKAQQELSGKDPFYADAISKLEQVIAATQRNMSDDRKNIDAKLEQLQGEFTQNQPVVQKLPEEQKALAAALEKRLVDINDARKQYNTAIAESAAGQDVLVTKMQEQIVTLQSGIDLRKKQSAEQAKKVLTAQEEQKRQESIAEKETALSAAAKVESDAQSKYLAKKTELLDLQSQLASSRTAGEQFDSLQKERNNTQRVYDGQLDTLKLRKQEVASIIELLPIPDDAAQAIDEADKRPLYVAGAAGLWCVMFGGLILLNLRGLHIEDFQHGLATVDSIRVAPLGALSVVDAASESTASGEAAAAADPGPVEVEPVAVLDIESLTSESSELPSLEAAKNPVANGAAETNGQSHSAEEPARA